MARKNNLSLGALVVLSGSGAQMRIEQIETCRRNQNVITRITLRDQFHRLHIATAEEINSNPRKPV